MSFQYCHRPGSASWKSFATRWPVLATSLSLVGCAGATDAPVANNPRQAERIAAALKGLLPGKPLTCIDQRRVQGTKRFDGTILYQYSPREIYRNNVTGGCVGLRYDDPILTRTPTTQFCRGDIIRTVSSSAPHMVTGSCALGSFIHYTR